MKKRVYIAGPYSRGDQAVNVRTAIFVADAVLALGYAPYLPHLTHFWHLLSPKEYEAWLRLDLHWLDVCDYLLRIPGDSPGADREVQRAAAIGIQAFYGIEQFRAFAEGKPWGHIR
jgi:hypothetical protein